MNSLIVWVLIIIPNSALCIQPTRIQFRTEAQCEAAKAAFYPKAAFTLTCEPRKGIKQ